MLLLWINALVIAIATVLEIDHYVALVIVILCTLSFTFLTTSASITGLSPF